MVLLQVLLYKPFRSLLLNPYNFNRSKASANFNYFFLTLPELIKTIHSHQCPFLQFSHKSVSSVQVPPLKKKKVWLSNDSNTTHSHQILYDTRSHLRLFIFLSSLSHGGSKVLFMITYVLSKVKNMNSELRVVGTVHMSKWCCYIKLELSGLTRLANHYCIKTNIELRICNFHKCVK